MAEQKELSRVERLEKLLKEAQQAEEQRHEKTRARLQKRYERTLEDMNAAHAAFERAQKRIDEAQSQVDDVHKAAAEAEVNLVTPDSTEE